MKFRDIPQLPRAYYSTTIPWDGLEHQLERWARTWVDSKTGKTKGGINLDPDYQRTHVWTETQQREYVEYMLRGGEVGRIITWNSVGWMSTWDNPAELVDGKQRLEAVRKFLRGEIKAFGTRYNEFEDRPSFTDHTFIFNVCKLQTREEILELYLNINAGGTPHTKEELDKVRKMLKALDKSK